MKNNKRCRLGVSTALGLAAFAAGSVPASGWAQSVPAHPLGSSGQKNILEEIVVTASRKRNESVQRTPIAVTAINAAGLERNHITNFDQIGKLAPNLQIQKNESTAGVANIYLRGFGQQSNDPAVDPRVAVYLDGIYQPAVIGSLFDTFDTEQIEVDAGPQGTLLGKNAPVGAIFITSGKPADKFGGLLEADYGSYDHYGLRGKVDVPLLKDSAGQAILKSHFSFSDTSGGNWIYNYATRQRDLGGDSIQAYRAAFAFTPTPEFEWDLNALYSHDNSPQSGNQPANYLGGYAGSVQNALQITPYPCVFQVPGGCEKMPYGKVDSTFTKRPITDQENIASNMHYTFYPVTATLVAGYSGLWQSDSENDAGAPFVALNAYGDKTRYDQESAELRISSNKGHGTDLGGLIDWVAGAYFSAFDYYFDNKLGIGVLGCPDGVAGCPAGGSGPFTVPVGVINSLTTQNGQTHSEAVFTHVIFNLTDKFKGTFGFRHSWDQKNHAALTSGAPYGSDPEADFSNNTFEGGLSYQLDPTKLVYVRFAQGYEAGGFAGFALGNTFQPETNNAYEIGIKTDWLKHRLRINANIFRNELSNLQVESALSIPNPPFFLEETLNAGSAVVQGVEAQILVVPIDAFVAHLNLGYLDAHYTENLSTTCSNTGAPVDCSGLNLAQSPKWTIDVGGDYTLGLPNQLGTAVLSMDWNYKASQYTDDPVYPSSYQKGYGLLRAGVAFHDITDKYIFEVYGNNITNQKYILNYTDPSGLAAWNELGRPAEWGIRLTGKF